ncbi:MAG: hypothetical protein WBB37_02065 [bacterium]
MRIENRRLGRVCSTDTTTLLITYRNTQIKHYHLIIKHGGKK